MKANPKSRSSAPPLHWFDIWRRALIPSVASYRDLFGKQRSRSVRVALAWTIASAVIGYLLSAARILFLEKNEYLLEVPPLYFVTCGPLLAIAFSILQLIFYAGVGQWIAHNLLHARGSFSQLIYAYSAFLAPLAILNAGLAMFELGLPAGPDWLSVSPILIAFEIYRIVLSLVASRAIYQLGRGKAIITALPVLIGTAFFVTLDAILINVSRL